MQFDVKKLEWTRMPENYSISEDKIEIDAGIKSMWYRFSRREDDYCIECSEDGIKYKQMRICHMYKAIDEIKFGIYACSPEDSLFKATFTNMEITDCKWLAHDGQAPDEE